VELLVSTVGLRPLDDERATEELEAVELPIVTLVEMLLDAVVELGELRMPLEATPRPTTISMTITTIATILEEIALAALAIVFHLAKDVGGAISDYARALPS
jgi:hypothetical protein